MSGQSQAFYLNGHGLSVEEATLRSNNERFELKVIAEENEWLLFTANRPFASGNYTLHVQYAGAIDGENSFGIFPSAHKILGD